MEEMRGAYETSCMLELRIQLGTFGVVSVIFADHYLLNLWGDFVKNPVSYTKELSLHGTKCALPAWSSLNTPLEMKRKKKKVMRHSKVIDSTVHK